MTTTTPIILKGQKYSSGNIIFEVTEVSCSNWRVFFRFINAGKFSDWDMDMRYAEMINLINNGDIYLVVG